MTTLVTAADAPWTSIDLRWQPPHVVMFVCVCFRMRNVLRCTKRFFVRNRGVVRNVNFHILTAIRRRVINVTNRNA